MGSYQPLILNGILIGQSSGGGGGSGTVTSVALSLPSSVFTISGSPVTTSGTLTGSFISQTANTFLAAPNGSSGVPTFRSIVAADLPSLSGTYVTQSEVGVANGVASLDSGGKVPVAQLPSSVMEYQGAWNPNTNTPTLSDGTGTNGNVYYVTAARASAVAGLTDPSMVNFQIGDLVIYSSSVGKWQLTTPAAGVQSVNGFQGAVVLTQGNLTDSTAGADGITVTSGTNAVWGSGTSIAQLQASVSQNGFLSSTDWSTFNSKQTSGNYITALTGDGTATGPGSATLTLATVNSNTGSFGSSTSIPNFTVNAKGLVTAAGSNVVVAPAGTLTGTTLNSTIVSSSLTSVGTITSGTWQGSVIQPAYVATLNQNTTGTAANITATTNSTLTTLSALSLSYSQITGAPASLIFSDSLVNTSGTVTLVNDSASPGDSQYYGTNSGGTLGYYSLPISSGDISQTSFTAADNQSSPANITGFAFSNSTIRSFDALVSVTRNNTYAVYDVTGVQNATGWYLGDSFVGDTTGIVFSITNSGQLQYTSTSTGFTAKIAFRGIVTNV